RFIGAYSLASGTRIELVTAQGEIARLGLTGGNWGTYDQAANVIYMRGDVLAIPRAVNEVGHEVGAAELYRVYGLPKDLIPRVLGIPFDSGGAFLTNVIDSALNTPD